jgi:hypothetical protein
MGSVWRRYEVSHPEAVWVDYEAIAGRKEGSSTAFMVICDAAHRRCAVKYEDEIAYLSSFQADQ